MKNDGGFGAASRKTRFRYSFSNIDHYNESCKLRGTLCSLALVGNSSEID